MHSMSMQMATALGSTLADATSNLASQLLTTPAGQGLAAATDTPQVRAHENRPSSVSANDSSFHCMGWKVIMFWGGR